MKYVELRFNIITILLMLGIAIVTIFIEDEGMFSSGFLLGLSISLIIRLIQ